VHTELTVTAADGSARRATGRIWPAGWNRVSVDLHGWDGRAAIVSISVAVLFDSIPAESTGPSAVMDAPTPAFHVGEMGYSTRRRTWP
jgi:alpha-L-rhamnosidase